MTAASAELTPSTALRCRPDVQVPCYWCRKVLQFCNGERTVAEVAGLSHLPLAVCLRLAARAVAAQWAEFALPPARTPVWEHLEAELTGLAVAQPGELLNRAAAMTRQTAGELSPAQLPSFLIALELLLDEADRDRLLPRLDDMQRHYGVAL